MATTAIDLHRLDLAYADLRVTERRQVAKLAAEIAQEGLRQPVLVVERGDRFVLVDGYRRVAAVRSLGHDTVAVLTLPLSERDALLFVFRTAATRRRFAIEDGWLLRELIERFELRQVDLAGLLDRSPSFVSRRLALVKQLPESIQKAVRSGRIGAHSAEKSLVPLARANRDHAERLVANLADLRPTTRQIARLYAAWRKADPATRERIVSHPALFLKADDEVASKLPQDDPVADLVRAIEMIAGACHGARKALRGAELHRLDAGGRDALGRAFAETTLAFGSVRALLSEEGLDAR